MAWKSSKTWEIRCWNPIHSKIFLYLMVKKPIWKITVNCFGEHISITELEMAMGICWGVSVTFSEHALHIPRHQSCMYRCWYLSIVPLRSNFLHIAILIISGLFWMTPSTKTYFCVWTHNVIKTHLTVIHINPHCLSSPKFLLPAELRLIIYNLTSQSYLLPFKLIHLYLVCSSAWCGLPS
jgi:hypothetical protein